MLQIGEVAGAVGLSLRTIRHYEEVGLVPPSGRTNAGFRLYTDDDVARLRLVKHMKPLEFTLEELRELLHVRDRLSDTDVPTEEREDLVARLRMFATAAEQRSSHLRAQLEAAEATADMLRREVRRHRTRVRSR
ncbi:MAG: MerR family transcriptional regulator [Actinomycetota bacterium]|nr:MerR family transcriptional regulator [Actinomycetota bacterium]